MGDRWSPHLTLKLKLSAGTLPEVCRYRTLNFSRSVCVKPEQSWNSSTSPELCSLRHSTNPNSGLSTTEYWIGSSAKLDTKDRFVVLINLLDRCEIFRPVFVCSWRWTGADIRRRTTETEGLERAANSISPRPPSERRYIWNSIVIVFNRLGTFLFINCDRVNFVNWVPSSVHRCAPRCLLTSIRTSVGGVSTSQIFRCLSVRRTLKTIKSKMNVVDSLLWRRCNV